MPATHGYGPTARNRGLANIHILGPPLRAMPSSVVTLHYALQAATLALLLGLARDGARATLLSAAANVDAFQNPNLYGNPLNTGANYFFMIFFVLVTLYNVVMLRWLRYWWYNVAFICGYLLQFLGYLGRVLSLSDYTNFDDYLLQFVCLTLLPVFLMGGIYFFITQLVVVHGQHYSLIKPMYYLYLFVLCDVVLLVVQASGGGIALSSFEGLSSSKTGTWVMFAGVLFQVVAMLAFLVLWLAFFYRMCFLPRPEPRWRPGIVTFLKLILCTPSALQYRRTLEPFYTPRFKSVRARPLVPWFPLAITVYVIMVFVRCVYRVVELEAGFDGYLMEHELLMMALDTSMITGSALILLFFHPLWVFGTDAGLGLKDVNKECGLAGQATGDDSFESASILEKATSNFSSS